MHVFEKKTYYLILIELDEMPRDSVGHKQVKVCDVHLPRNLFGGKKTLLPLCVFSTTEFFTQTVFQFKFQLIVKPSNLPFLHSRSEEVMFGEFIEFVLDNNYQ